MARTLFPPPPLPFQFATSRLKPSRRPARAWRLGPVAFGYAAAFADAAAVLLAALATVAIYDFLRGAGAGAATTGVAVGLVAAALVVMVGAHNGGYAQSRYASLSGQFARALPLWNSVCLAMLALSVATRDISEFPRAALALFYALGLVALTLTRRGGAQALSALTRRGLAARRRVAIVGFENEIDNIRPATDDDGARIVCTFALREAEWFFAEDLALAVASIRLHRADDVFVALPWARGDLIDACLAQMMKLPVEVHLGLGGPFRQAENVRLAQVGAVCGLTLTRRPLGSLQHFEKRAFDVAVALAALVALAPLFAAVALAIRLDSPGPALFRQKRYGLNQEPFRIYKFRTMRTMDDGRIVKQATREDARVTRVGAYLRRLSIDELPQLLNVLNGEMSIVGPRPHALSHDQLYVARLARYARRHAVKPGITGWAQVCGHRGEIADDSAMLARLDHDLDYIDNWSLWLDVKIVALTAFSRKAHANAY